MHRKIMSLVKVTRDEAQHWVISGSRTLYVRDVDQVLTTRRAAYAAFLGPIPENFDVRTTCGVFGCVKPQHAVLEQSRRGSRALDLSGQVAALARAEVFQGPDSPNILPKGFSIELVDRAKVMFLLGNSLGMVAAALGLPTHEVAKIRGGQYDAALANLRKAAKADKKAGEEGSCEVPKNVRAPASLSSATPKEEEAWLEQVARNC